ncbi:uncharacterized protein [Dendropsophus ebraccatus]|uniref:uncharacterized protein n=1 Tax=Dendropsophus ebraccatus TaxID=150705 RepID=UPI00383218BA
MAFHTTSFNNDEAREIMARITSSSQFLQIPSSELRGRTYERELKRITSLELHSATLAEYHRVQRIPRGLRVNLRPTLFSENQDYCTKFEGILNKCSMDIILLSLQFLDQAIRDCNTRISTMETQLQNSLTPEDWSALKQNTDKTTNDFKVKLEDKKRNKFFRDTEDYLRDQVYKWQETLPPRHRSHRQPQYSSEDQASSSSGSDLGSYRGRMFHGPRNRNRQGNRTNQTTTRGHQPRMQTRSQV